MDKIKNNFNDFFFGDVFPELEEVKKYKLWQFYTLLTEQNEKHNLTRIKGWDSFLKKHVLDSILFTNNFNIENKNICDVGTGAGFPGLVLKIFYPNIKLTLIESNGKKCNFLNLIIKNLELNNVRVINSRSENVSLSMKEEFDIVVARAVTNLTNLLELLCQMVKCEGYLIALKGPLYKQELEELDNNEKKLGLILYKVEECDLIGEGKRFNLFYKKINSTPNKYPRPYSIMLKKPLYKEK